ncbi:ubiquinol-cytochrome C chaperone family protein [Pseudomonas sp. ChxA]|uniref:ubiquinol-cytochrome C chaperone family protein n=1 Tax=Pseudomonas sp. ChxA TaxID=3035473 RepID=UPI00255667BC|nr:ubiquinol-cytochrome C chaperone family protein [Pseudomonas sp. ChxA]MDL2185682.1 ubiquinol-cytochrome C chaperone family protein [Pseudomonas sp. ChxA]
MNLDEILSTSSIEAILSVSDVEDISAVVNYLTDNGEGRLALDGDVCKRLVAARDAGRYTDADHQLIAREIRLFGGNSLLNLFRKDGVAYDEIVDDVAKHLKVNHADDPVNVVEQEILGKILSRAFEQMTDAERKAVLDELGVASYSTAGPAAAIAAICAAKAGGFATYKIAAIVANAIAKAILGKGLSFVATGQLMRSISVAIGPIGWAITALWTAADLASPAYRVTVPCVVQLAYMRQKAIMLRTVKTCSQCQHPIAHTARFCSECGNAAAA